jgi:hypothetical protein
MKKTTLLRFAALAATAFGLAACDLAIDNPTQGDTERVLGTADDAEALISTYYKRWSSGVYGSTGDLEGMANVMSLMNYSSLANNCQNNHLPFAGSANSNNPGNVCGGEQVRLYQFMNEQQRRGPELDATEEHGRAESAGAVVGGVPAGPLARLPGADARLVVDRLAEHAADGARV